MQQLVKCPVCKAIEVVEGELCSVCVAFNPSKPDFASERVESTTEEQPKTNTKGEFKMNELFATVSGFVTKAIDWTKVTYKKAAANEHVIKAAGFLKRFGKDLLIMTGIAAVVGTVVTGPWLAMGIAAVGYSAYQVITAVRADMKDGVKVDKTDVAVLAGTAVASNFLVAWCGVIMLLTVVPFLLKALVYTWAYALVFIVA